MAKFFILCTVSFGEVNKIICVCDLPCAYDLAFAVFVGDRGVIIYSLHLLVLIQNPFIFLNRQILWSLM